MSSIRCRASLAPAANCGSTPPAPNAGEIAIPPSSTPATAREKTRGIRPGHRHWPSGRLAPQFPAREPRAIAERLQLDPDDARMHLAGRGEAGKATIGAGDNVLAPDCLRKTADALGDQ